MVHTVLGSEVCFGYGKFVCLLAVDFGFFIFRLMFSVGGNLVSVSCLLYTSDAADES